MVDDVADGGESLVANLWLTYWADHFVVFLAAVKPDQNEGQLACVMKRKGLLTSVLACEMWVLREELVGRFVGVGSTYGAHQTLQIIEGNKYHVSSNHELIASHTSKYKHQKGQNYTRRQELPIISLTNVVLVASSRGYNADF